jgi:hypothetical protein
MGECDVCHQERLVVSALVDGKYHRSICNGCLHPSSDDISSGSASYDRRRGYEDFAQDTIQPYDANGKPRSEFYRLYPKAAEGVFTAQEIAEVKRKI